MFVVEIRFDGEDEIFYFLGEYRENEKYGNMLEFEFPASKTELRKMKENIDKIIK